MKKDEVVQFVNGLTAEQLLTKAEEKNLGFDNMDKAIIERADELKMKIAEAIAPSMRKTTSGSLPVSVTTTMAEPEKPKRAYRKRELDSKGYEGRKRRPVLHPVDRKELPTNHTIGRIAKPNSVNNLKNERREFLRRNGFPIVQGRLSTDQVTKRDQLLKQGVDSGELSHAVLELS